jgi:hypothetical protein
LWRWSSHHEISIEIVEIRNLETILVWEEGTESRSRFYIEILGCCDKSV